MIGILIFLFLLFYSSVAPILAGLNLTSPECIWELHKNGSTNALNCMTGYP